MVCGWTMRCRESSDKLVGVQDPDLELCGIRKVKMSCLVVGYRVCCSCVGVQVRDEKTP